MTGYGPLTRAYTSSLRLGASRHPPQEAADEYKPSPLGEISKKMRKEKQMKNETLKTINNLRTIHGNFSEKEISDDDLKIILDSSVKAANASARQSYSIIVVKDKEKMSKLCGYKGNCLLLFCVDFYRIIKTAQEMGHDFSSPEIVGFVTGAIDTILASQTATIAAKSLGIDSIFTNGIHRGDISRIYKILNLPEKWCFPLIALILGYTDKEPKKQKGRLKGKGIIHYESYEQITKKEIEDLIEEYDQTENPIGLIENWKNMGFKHYLDWFYTKWSANKSDTKHMYDILKKSGFIMEDIND